MGNIWVDDARTLKRFWKKWGHREKFIDSVAEIQWSREETLSGRYNIRFHRVSGNPPQGGDLLLSGGETSLDVPGQSYIFEPSFRGIVPCAFGAFLAALGNRCGEVEKIVEGVERGQHVGEVWLKLEELFPQAKILIQTKTEITFIVDPVQEAYWKTIKPLIPFSPRFPVRVVHRGAFFSVSYFDINPITEGAFIWTTQK
jgi:hypothetical protein